MVRVWVAIVVAVLLSGCSSYPERDVNLTPVGLVYAKTEIPDSHLLGVRIAVFDPGQLPEGDDRSSGLSMEIRKAEARFIATHLKNVMQRTGIWGPVRVVPTDSPYAEVMVNGRILESDGEVLRLEVAVRDATGALWLSREYEGVIDLPMHREAGMDRMEPFRFLYNRIANDIARHRAWMSGDAVTGIRRVAELRFAEAYAPGAFAGYLDKSGAAADEPERNHESDAAAESDTDSDTDFAFAVDTETLARDDGASDDAAARFRIQRLPAEDDPMLVRVRRLRARDDMLVDTLDMEYDGLYRRLDGPYREWRMSRVIEIDAIRELEAERNAELARGVVMILGAVLFARATGGNTAPGLVGAVGAMGVRTTWDAVKKASDDSKIHKAGLTELGESFAADAEPVAIEVDGKTVRLTGSAEEKFSQWRQILETLRVRETGPALSQGAAAPPPTHRTP